MKKSTERIICCPECGTKLKTTTVYTWTDKFLGDLRVEELPGEYRYCPKCKQELFTQVMMYHIEKAEQIAIEQLLLQSVNYNMEAFKAALVTKKQLTFLLEKSRQALQRDGRINTLIFHFDLDGKSYWWKDSVMKFKQTGDGRYILNVPTSPVVDKPDFEFKSQAEVDAWF